ncbi:HutD family protein [Luteimonas marina]|uniref:HutD family protein n=1 Tax=Luteimonas marina TaxID=488485 RepID=A0A5C5TWN1_9GAMM|nr:HutD family protein [Luteimonas marina]TWT18603.1 HutD family protein [Luteimonas marina]
MGRPARVIPANEYRRVRWKNGAGWTREIHAESGAGSGEWDWRLSIAEIEADAPFSVFPGVDRELVLLGGNGLRLCFDDGETHELLPPCQRLRFTGERTLVGELVDGRTEDFNLMWRRDAVATQLWHRPLVGAMVVFVDPGSTWVVHLLAGRARIAGDAALPPLAMGDTALLTAPDGRARYVLDGGGEALLIRIDRREPRPASPTTV